MNPTQIHWLKILARHVQTMFDLRRQISELARDQAPRLSSTKAPSDIIQ
jgi:hypothetical protein